MRRALLLSGAPGSVGHVYRIEHAVAALRARNWRAEWRGVDDAGATDAIGQADVVTVFRTPWGEPFAAIHDRCRHVGIPLIFDIDDLLFDPQVMVDGHVALLDHCSGEQRRFWLDQSVAFARSVAAADAAVLTTAPLAEAALRLCPQAVVLPNALGPGMEAMAAAARTAPRPSRADGRPRLLFASGTSTHQRDFTVAAVAIAQLFARRREPLLVVIGPLDISAYPALVPFRDRIECRPRVPLAALFAEIARADINLCPLELGNPFCASKSAVRWLTAAVIGLPSVATHTPPLQDVIDHGVTGLLATDANGWIEALEYLIDDPDARERLGEGARQTALARFGFDRWSADVARVYGSIVDRGPRPGVPR